MSDVIDKKQKLLLEYLFSNKELYISCARILKVEYFAPPLDRVVKFTLHYFSDHNELPNFDIIDAETDVELKFREVDPDEYEYVQSELEQHCIDSAMSIAIMESVDLLNEGNRGAIQDKIKEALAVKLDNSLGTDFFEDPKKRIEEMDLTVEERSFGIPSLDNVIGKIRRGEMGVVYGVTGGGKSVTLANFAYLLTQQQLDGVVISLELKEELYAKRLDAIFTNTDIKNHKSNSDDIARELSSMEGNSGSLVLKHMVNASVLDIRNFLLEYNVQKGKMPDFVMVDYLGIMGNDGIKFAGANKFDIDEYKAKGLRDIFAEFNIYGFTAGQINRDGIGLQDINVSHCAGGKSVVDTSDWSIALYASEEDIDNNQIQAKQLKVRNNGKVAKAITLYMNPQTLRVSEQPTVAKKPAGSGRALGKQPTNTPKISDAEKLKSALARTKR